jgi:hypothetical protein
MMQLPVEATEVEVYEDSFWVKDGMKPKSQWKDGPWKDEPDKIVWKTKAGLPGMIVRNHVGALCGYAAVSESHPAFNKGSDLDVEVHGGLTYGDFCGGNICHVPQPGEPDHVFWHGFDCSHCWDICPAEYREGRAFNDREDTEYRDITYVVAQVESLAAQLAAMKP